MSYQDQANASFRTPINLIELKLDNVLALNGAEMHSDSLVPLGLIAHSSVLSVDTAPVRATPGKGLGYRGQLVVTFQDFDHPGGGTYFGRLLGSNPYFLDREIVFYSGFESDGPFDLGNYKKQVYFIKEIEGPDDRGRVKIKGLDILSKLDSDRAIVPNEYNLVLNAGLTDTQTGSISVKNAAKVPAGTYYVKINDEVLRATFNGSGNMTIISRTHYGSEAAEHELDDNISLVYTNENINVVDLIYSLLDEHTEIDVAEYIDLPEWEYERDTFLSSEDMDMVLFEPTEVKSLLESLTAQSFSLLWWDDENQKIKLKSIRPNITNSRRIDTTSFILDKGHSIKLSQGEAINEVWVYYNRRDILKDEKKASNYRDIYIFADVEAQEQLGSRKIEQIYANNIQIESTAAKLATRKVSQMMQGSREMQFRLDPKHAGVSIGDIIEVLSYLDQGPDGIEIARSYLVTEKENQKEFVSFRALATGFAIYEVARYGRIAPNTLIDYATATAAEKDRYVALCDETLVMSDERDGYLLL